MSSISLSALIWSEGMPRWVTPRVTQVFQEQIQGCPGCSSPVQRQEVPQEGGRDGGMAENSPSHSGCNPTANPDSSTKHPWKARGGRRPLEWLRSWMYNRLERALWGCCLLESFSPGNAAQPWWVKQTARVSRAVTQQLTPKSALLEEKALRNKTSGFTLGNRFIPLFLRAK